ncbi:MAG TPA: GNAT family N-acetyltransferase [Polyangia bacterium]|nr:GNAT family N-acetyltransferase [Polyangia bacterium]
MNVPVETFVRLPLALDEALAFAALHPVGHLDEAMRRRLITALTSDPAGTIVLGDAGGALRLVATVVDVIDDRTAPAELVILGARPGLPGAAFADGVLAPARAFARAGGRRVLHTARPTFVTDVDEVLARDGFTFAYEIVAMRRAHAALAPAEPTLPSGWRWAALDDALVEPAHVALGEMFRGMPAMTLPPLPAFRSGAFSPPPGYQLLMDGEAVAGLVRLSASGDGGVVRVLGRVPAYRGRGLGRLLLDRGLRLLAAAGVRTVMLEVLAMNDRALALYRAFGFAVVEHTPTLAAAV